MSRITSFLSGVKVVDLSRHLPGPLASLLMVDMGAEVIKVESPQGDEIRFIGPEGKNKHSVYFDSVNAGKCGVRLDLKSETGRIAFLDLIKDADVLIESFRPGVLSKLDLSIEFLKEFAPRLIICSLNGYGENSPLNQEVGHDLNYLAMNGVLEGTGTVNETVAPWPPIADCTASLFGMSSIIAALYEREKSGVGCHIEIALADSVMPLMAFSLAELGLKGHGIPRAQALLNGGAARYRTYLTADGKSVALGAVEPKFWQAFCLAAGREDWVARIDEPLPQIALQREVSSFIKSLTLDECNQRFGNVDCCFNQVLELADAVNTSHIKARKLLIKTADGEYQALFPAYVDGEAPVPRSNFKDLSK